VGVCKKFWQYFEQLRYRNLYEYHWKRNKKLLLFGGGFGLIHYFKVGNSQ